MGLGMRWYRNGEEVSPGPRVVISGFTMTIYGLLDGDSGMYQCSVSNGTSSVWRQWRVVVSSECAYVIRGHTCTCTGVFACVIPGLSPPVQLHGFNRTTFSPFCLCLGPIKIFITSLYVLASVTCPSLRSTVILYLRQLLHVATNV